MIKKCKLKILLYLFLVACGNAEEQVRPPSSASEIKDPVDLIKLADSKKTAGAYDEAIDALDKALQLDPLSAQVFYQKGLIYEEWDKREEALEAYREAIEINPDHNDARLGLASLYDKSVLNELALEQYLKVAETIKNDPELYFKIALEYWYLQDILKTAEYYNRVIELNKDHLQAHLNLVSVYERMKDWEKALWEVKIVKQLSSATQDQQAMKIAENKLKFIEGRMNLTKGDIKRKSEPPFN